jgi:peroxiredoxin Q/BCP
VFSFGSAFGVRVRRSGSAFRFGVPVRRSGSAFGESRRAEGGNRTPNAELSTEAEHELSTENPEARTARIQMLIEPGQKAPAFALKDQNGELHRLSDYAGQPVVLYFYPKDDTPGCTKESCEFQALLPTYKRRKAVVLGISILDEKSKAKFASKYDLTFPLLADADHAVAEKYGVWQEKSRYGRKYMGVARTTYLIGPDGKVAQRWDNVKVDGHAQAVAEAL